MSGASWYLKKKITAAVPMNTADTSRPRRRPIRRWERMGINRTQAKTVVVARGDVSANIMVMQNGRIKARIQRSRCLVLPMAQRMKTE